MTNYIVAVNDSIGYKFHISLKVKHFRQYEGRVAKTTGGHTAIFDVDSGLVFSSKCRDDEQFSRRKGILTCLQKMLQSEAFHCGELKEEYWITDVKFTSDGCLIFVNDLPPENRYWWLQKYGNRLGSGLYA
jgi:hypothetical protein